MSRALLTRITRLEAAHSSVVRRLLTYIATGVTEAEVEAEIETFMQEKGLTDRDTLVVFTFSDPEPGASGSESLYEVRPMRRLEARS
jgi:hypothetical protein